MKAGLIFLSLFVATTASATLYEVGTNKPYQNIGDVPLESLVAGDCVRIYWRSTPYREKWVITANGTPTNPVTFQGVPNEQGLRPAICGENAITSTNLDFWNEPRAIIKIGGSSDPPDDPRANFITIENFDIHSAHPVYQFYDDHGTLQTYADNAAAVFIEKGAEITLRNCVFHDCGNGLQTASAGGANSNLLVEYCTFYDNGIEGSWYEHNNYTEFNGIIFQHNFFGPLRTSCLGNNLKDRSAGLVVRWNTIIDGNRQLDLVDSSSLQHLPNYSNTWVYGNVLIEQTDSGNRQITHYGGDSGDTSRYRKGCLHFLYNTVVSRRTDRTTLFRLSSNDEYAECVGNIIYTDLDGNTLAMLDASGELALCDNWMKSGWQDCFGTLTGSITNLGGLVHTADPGFALTSSNDFRLLTNSVCLDRQTNFVLAAFADYDGVARPLDGDNNGIPAADLGAFELARPDVDTDGDAMSDYAEIIAVTCPTNANDYWSISHGSNPSNGHQVLSWTVATQRYYSLEYSTTLTADWQTDPACSNQAGYSGTMTITNTNPAARFFRVRVAED
jgi:hypothetical protein